MRLLPIDYAARNLGRSVPRLLLAVGGSALVVLLVLSAAAFVRGMDSSLRATGEPHNVILLGAGSEEAIERSEVDASVAGLVSASIDGLRTRAGAEYVSPEVHAMLPTQTGAGSGPTSLVLLRGVTPSALLVHSSLQIVEGRFPTAGADELLIGAMVSGTLHASAADVATGSSLIIDGRPWKIVGRFVSPGTVFESEIWTARTDLMQATKRETDSCVVITLDPEQAEFADVAAFTKTRVDLELSAIPESDYYARLSDFFAPIRVVVWATAALIAVGGLLGGLNTMYAAFVSRVRELGTLQAIGYRRGAIVASMVQESSLATAAGTLIACAVGIFIVDGASVRFSLGAFGLVVDAPVVLIAIASGVALGLVGSLPPAWQCLRMTIPVALKSV